MRCWDADCGYEQCGEKMIAFKVAAGLVGLVK